MPQTTSGKTAAEIITIARYEVNDSDAPYFASDVEMLAWLNKGRFKIAMDGHGLQKTEEITLTTALEYTPANDYIKIVSVQYTDASGNVKALRPGSPNGVGHEYDVSEPVYYYEYDGKIGVYPQLSSATTEKIKLFEACETEDLTSAGTIDTPAIFDSALVDYIKSRHLWKDAKYAASAQAMASFDSAIYQARAELTGTKK